MTSSGDDIQSAIDFAYQWIKNFDSTPLGDVKYFDSYILGAAQTDGQFELEDILPSAIDKSETSLLIFLSLKRIAARYISHKHTMPSVLEVWLVDYLNEIRKQPTSGKTGPNNSLVEQMSLLNLVRTMSVKFEIPTWPRETHQPKSCVLDIVAAASKRFKEETGKTPYPLTTGSMEKRYNQARRFFIPKTVNPAK